MINPDDLIPPDGELAQLLMQWSEETDTSTWNIANITNELIEELFVGNGGMVTRADVYKAVATRCKGKKPNTIRRWAEVAADFPKDVQDKYASLLSFDHFKVARRLANEGYAPSAEYVLDWAVSGNDLKLSAGKFHTVGSIMNHFMPKETFEKDARKFWGKVKEQMYDLIILEDNDTTRAILMSNWHDFNKFWGLDKDA